MNSSYAKRGSLLLFCFAFLVAAAVSASPSPTPRPAPTPNPPPQAASSAVNLLSFGNAGFGGDDTSIFQDALNSTAAQGQVLEIPAGSYNISPVFFPTGANVQCDGGVTVNANGGYAPAEIMLNLTGNNITLAGAGGSENPSDSTCVFQMPVAYAQSANDGSQYRHCLGIYGGADNVNVSGIACNHAGGDGVWLTDATNVTVSNSVFSANYRNGGSLVGRTNHTTFTGDQFLNQRNINAGFDVEPNFPTDYVMDLNFDKSSFNNNELSGLCICIGKLDGTSQPVSITITDSVANGNGDTNGYSGNNGLFFANNNQGSNPSGSLNVTNFSTDGSAYAGVYGKWCGNGLAANFTNVTVTNPFTAGPVDPHVGGSAAVAVSVYGGSSCSPGNVQFSQTNVSSTNGNMSYYFDLSGSNVSFDLTGTLSGASKAPPNGLMFGQTANSVP